MTTSASDGPGQNRAQGAQCVLNQITEIAGGHPVSQGANIRQGKFIKITDQPIEPIRLFIQAIQCIGIHWANAVLQGFKLGFRDGERCT